jgi:hypothetical protein
MVVAEMNFEGFTALDFPPINLDIPKFVYVLCWVGESEEVPFYVGQTSRIWGRLDDYYWATLSAPTDFRVGEAVRYLHTKGYLVVVKYKSIADSRRAESDIIEELHRLRGATTLLNDLSGFDWKKADELEERRRIHAFIDILLTDSAL